MRNGTLVLAWGLCIACNACGDDASSGPASPYQNPDGSALDSDTGGPKDAGGDVKDAGGDAKDGAGGQDAAGDSTAAEAGPDPCAPIPGVSYSTGSVKPETFQPDTHGDINLLLRKWQAVGEVKGLIDVGGPTDDKAPKLYTLFTDDRMPVFAEVYQVQSWDWGCNCAGAWVTDPPVTLAGFAMDPGEIVQLPRDGYDIGGGYQALVLYVADNTITLKYTRDDNVVGGYTIHLANLCVEPSLRALYDQSHANGRKELPQLKGDEPLGRARTSQLLVTIRDTGSWMDPRVKKDWYQP
ncbi:MAG: hypothetical protein HY898_24005 [Deltaproteobacteria bacterium]|nr:hypothetical protein [Deltaproteobacteria bacterium]